MTNKEAITILQEWLHGCCGEELDPDREAFRLAISALSQDGDTISRQWCLNEYDKRHQGPPGGARKIIEEAPAVKPDPSKCWGCNCPKIERQEIIRCKDCFWYRHNLHGETWCDHPHGLIGWVKDTDYCSKSERRTDG